MNDGSTTFQVVMPRLGLTMIEATIKEWLKPEGAWVEEGEALFVLEEEKATLEIESPASGRLHILVAEGQVATILSPIAILEGGKTTNQHIVEKVELPSTLPQRKERVELSVAVEMETGAREICATPKARNLARQQGISLERIQGSGPRNMIVAGDLQETQVTRTPIRATPLAQKVARETGVDLASVNGSGPRGQVMRRDIETSTALSSQTESDSGLAALTGLRSVIAKRLSSSWIERPQVTLTTDADATALVAFRQQAQAEWNLKLSYNALLVKLVSKALLEHPYINVQLFPMGIQTMPDINIGVAVDTERGLMVPVLQNADRKSIFEIQDEIQLISQHAIEGRSIPSEICGGTFTITNLGMYEIDAFTPIINPPECAILGVGRIISRPVGVNGQIVLKEMMALSLSFDHRLVDGAPAARFLQRIKTLIERCALLGFDK
ncbi:MAG: dihydrolipoamide acetyltransferase family protein [Leptolinea sp.]